MFSKCSCKAFPGKFNELDICFGPGEAIEESTDARVDFEGDPTQ
jgi:hypothetical protein